MASYYPLTYISTFAPFDQHKSVSIAAITTDLTNLYQAGYFQGQAIVSGGTYVTPTAQANGSQGTGFTGGYSVKESNLPPSTALSGFQNVSCDRVMLYATSATALAVGVVVWRESNDFQNYIVPFFGAAMNIYCVVAPLQENGTETILTINAGVITAINTFTYTIPAYNTRANLLNVY